MVHRRSNVEHGAPACDDQHVTEPSTEKLNHVPLINIIGGVVMIVVFGLFMINGYPPSRSIIPPVGVAAGVVLIVVGLISQARRRRASAHSHD